MFVRRVKERWTKFDFVHQMSSYPSAQSAYATASSAAAANHHPHPHHHSRAAGVGSAGTGAGGGATGSASGAPVDCLDYEAKFQVL